MTADIEPEEHSYLVVVEHTFTYRVLAESPAVAAAIIDNGEYDAADEQECLFSSVERVVAGDGSWSDPDLREPKKCAGSCGTTLDPSQPNECTACFLARLKREREARDAAGRTTGAGAR